MTNSGLSRSKPPNDIFLNCVMIKSRLWKSMVILVTSATECLFHLAQRLMLSKLYSMIIAITFDECILVVVLFVFEWFLTNQMRPLLNDNLLHLIKAEKLLFWSLRIDFWFCISVKCCYFVFVHIIVFTLKSDFFFWDFPHCQCFWEYIFTFPKLKHMSNFSTSVLCFVHVVSYELTFLKRTWSWHDCKIFGWLHTRLWLFLHPIPDYFLKTCPKSYRSW